MPNDQGIPYGAARELTQKRWGVPLTFQETNFSVTSTNQVIVKNNPDRVSLTFVNNGANDMFVGLSTLVATVGIKIVNSGQAINFNVDDDGEMPAQTWWAISSLGTSCYVLEGIAAPVPAPVGPSPVVTRPYTGDY